MCIWNVYYTCVMAILISRLDMTLPMELLSEFKKTVPKRKRSSFIAKILREELAEIKCMRAIEKLSGIWDKADGVKLSTDRDISSWRKNLWASFDTKLARK